MRYLLTISYLGTSFCGWQVQPNGKSVQAEICAALELVLGNKTDVTGCSRTDSGVHAKKFCCHFDADTELSEKKLADAVQYNTSPDICVLSCKRVPGNFHARYSCLGKNYIYRISNTPHEDPFERGRAMWFRYPLDIERMNDGAARLLDKHDFSAFCSAGSSVKDKVRCVTECSVSKCGDNFEISVSADGFLYNMVRIIAGTLIEIGNGKRKPQDILIALESGKREDAGITAPPQGLYLNDVYYSFEGEENG